MTANPPFICIKKEKLRQIYNSNKNMAKNYKPTQHTQKLIQALYENNLCKFKTSTKYAMRNLPF